MEVDTGAAKEPGVEFGSPIESDDTEDPRDRPMTVLQR
jgi:hypothetical protein